MNGEVIPIILWGWGGGDRKLLITSLEILLLFLEGKFRFLIYDMVH